MENPNAKITAEQFKQILVMRRREVASLTASRDTSHIPTDDKVRSKCCSIHSGFSLSDTFQSKVLVKQRDELDETAKKEALLVEERSRYSFFEYLLQKNILMQNMHFPTHALMSIQTLIRTPARVAGTEKKKQAKRSPSSLLIYMPCSLMTNKSTYAQSRAKLSKANPPKCAWQILPTLSSTCVGSMRLIVRRAWTWRRGLGSTLQRL
jgi:hypothetical protein